MGIRQIGPPWARIELRIRNEKLISGIEYLFGNNEGIEIQRDNAISVEILDGKNDIANIKGEITGLSTSGQAINGDIYCAYESDWAGIYDIRTREGKIAIHPGNFIGLDTFLRQIAIYHSYENGYLPLHSVAFEYQGKAYICPGESDSGKSTIAGLIKDEATVYSDEINVIGGNPLEVWSLPFRGTSPNTISTGGRCLTAILIHRKAKSASVETIKKPAAIIDVENSVIVPLIGDPDLKRKAFDLLIDAITDTNTYVINFPKNGRAFLDAIRYLGGD